MDAQIIINQDYAGYHNGDLETATGRIVEGGTWRDQSVIVITPAAKRIAAKVYLSHLSLAFPPNGRVHRALALGLEVGEAYSQTIRDILKDPVASTFKYVLTLEHDNCPPPGGVIDLIKRMEAHPEFACIGGLYWTKGPGGVPQIWGDPKDPVLNFRPQPPDPAGGLVECCGTGMGFNLFRLEMFKDERLRRPWFKTLAGKDGMATQDLYFWQDARVHGYRCAIDCSVRVGHYDLEGAFGQPDMMW